MVLGLGYIYDEAIQNFEKLGPSLLCCQRRLLQVVDLNFANHHLTAVEPLSR